MGRDELTPTVAGSLGHVWGMRVGPAKAIAGCWNDKHRQLGRVGRGVATGEARWRGSVLSGGGSEGECDAAPGVEVGAWRAADAVRRGGRSGRRGRRA